MGEREKPHYTYSGWRYLFKAYGRTPAKSNVDIVLGWIYPDEISEDVPDLKVFVVDTIDPDFTEKPLAIYQSGIYRSYIFTNNHQSPLE